MMKRTRAPSSPGVFSPEPILRVSAERVENFKHPTRVLLASAMRLPAGGRTATAA